MLSSMFEAKNIKFSQYKLIQPFSNNYPRKDKLR